MGEIGTGSSRFRVGLTRDFLGSDGGIAFEELQVGLDLLDAAGVDHAFLARGGPQMAPEDAAGFDALLVLGPRITRSSLAGADRLVAIARWGVGYDNVDVAACTEQGVALTITPEGVRRPVAHAALTLLLALAHRLPAKDRLVREGRWAEKSAYMGTGLTGATVGVIGFGNIGREVCRLTAAFGMRPIAFDPFVDAEVAASSGVEPVDLVALLGRSDFVVVCCALTPQTHHLLDAERLALLRRSAYLVNVARGPIVDGRALAEALQSGRIRGAGLDVFEKEPPDPADPLLQLENVILSPHALSWTDESFSGIARQACRGLVELSRGNVPEAVVNREVLDHPRFVDHLRKYAEEGAAS